MKDALELKQDIVFRTTLRGQELEFHSTWGLFSPREIDVGSRMLVEEIELEPGHLSLDLGCGYGAIGIPVARCCPAGRVHMVDKDAVALRYALQNAQINNVSNCLVYESNALSAVKTQGFDNVISNIPANVGRELLYIILSDAWDHLKPGGRLYVVTIAGIRKFIQRNLTDVFGNYHKLRQGGTYTVAMAERTPYGHRLSERDNS
ncbi:MAG: methyltransferase [Phycisphaeraceae bacterium]|nr:methyltransferase [Phycisphaeraceae bacterium]